MKDWKPISTAPKTGVKIWLKGLDNIEFKGFFVHDKRYKYGGYWQLKQAIWPAGGPILWAKIIK